MWSVRPLPPGNDVLNLEVLAAPTTSPECNPKSVALCNRYAGNLPKPVRFEISVRYTISPVPHTFMKTRKRTGSAAFADTSMTVQHS